MKILVILLFLLISTFSTSVLAEEDCRWSECEELTVPKQTVCERQGLGRYSSTSRSLSFAIRNLGDFATLGCKFGSIRVKCCKKSKGCKWTECSPVGPRVTPCFSSFGANFTARAESINRCSRGQRQLQCCNYN